MLDTQRLDDDILGKARAGHGQAPGQRRNDGGEMQGGGRGDARFAGLAGNVDLHAEPVAQPACLQHGAQAAELDRLQADALRGFAGMMALDIVARMDALIGADGTRLAAATRAMPASRGRDRLLEETEACVGDRTHVAERLLDAKTLIGVGGNEAVPAERPANVPRARGVGLGASTPTLIL